MPCQPTNGVAGPKPACKLCWRQRRSRVRPAGARTARPPPRRWARHGATRGRRSPPAGRRWHTRCSGRWRRPNPLAPRSRLRQVPLPLRSRHATRRQAGRRFDRRRRQPGCQANRPMAAGWAAAPLGSPLPSQPGSWSAVRGRRSSDRTPAGTGKRTPSQPSASRSWCRRCSASWPAMPAMVAEFSEIAARLASMASRFRSMASRFRSTDT